VSARTLPPSARAADADVPSPCVSVCVMDPDSGYCRGCYRSLDEIAAWITLDGEARLAVWDAIAERRKTLEDR
jgi:predicted Fe-S protein YdhL (DUF1289 family)